MKTDNFTQLTVEFLVKSIQENPQNSCRMALNRSIVFHDGDTHSLMIQVMTSCGDFGFDIKVTSAELEVFKALAYNYKHVFFKKKEIAGGECIVEGEEF